MRRALRWMILLMVTAPGVGMTPSMVAAQQAHPEPEAPLAERCRIPEARQFDFWMGEWEVRNAAGEVLGHNSIRRVSAGCALLENWQGAGGGVGLSLNTYDTDLGRWTQRWVGNGATLWLVGGLEGESMVLTGTAPRGTPRGPVLDRLTWTPLAGGSVRQAWEISADEGRTWTVAFEGFYYGRM